MRFMEKMAPQVRRHPEVRALARLEGWAACSYPSRLAEDGEHLRMTAPHVRGERRRLTALRRGVRATRGCNRLVASRRGLAGGCGPRASSVSIFRASIT